MKGRSPSSCRPWSRRSCGPAPESGKRRAVALGVRLAAITMLSPGPMASLLQPRSSDPCLRLKFILGRHNLPADTAYMTCVTATPPTCWRAGVHPKIAQERLGHSSVERHDRLVPHVSPRDAG